MVIVPQPVKHRSGPIGGLEQTLFAPSSCKPAFAR
jgi:hypothetical protein